MATAALQEVLHLQQKLERNIGDDKALQVVKKLKNVPMTVEILLETGIGKTIRNLRKKPGDLGQCCKSLILAWKDVVVNAQDSLEQYQEAGRPQEPSRTPPLKVEREDSYTVYGDDNDDDLREKKPSKPDRHERVKVHHASTKNGCDAVSKSKHKERNAKHDKEKEVTTSKRVVPSKHDASSKQEVTTKHNASSSKRDASTKHDVSSSSKRDASTKHDLSSSSKRDASTKHDASSSSKRDVPTKHDAPPKREKPSAHEASSKREQLPKRDEKPKKAENDAGDAKGRSKVQHVKPKSPEKAKINKTQKKLLSADDNDGFTSSMASFEDCLSLNDVSMKKKKPATVAAAPSPPKKSRTPAPSSKVPNAATPSSERAAKKRKKVIDDEVTREEIKKALDISIDSTLPMTNPTYKPMRYNMPDSPPRKKKQGLPEVDPTSFMSSRHNRTQVFSGRRTHTFTEVVSLYDLCIRVLQENIDALEYTGGVPYDQLKPVLARCTPQQLYQIEDFNPYLVEDTEELWKAHCQHEFKGKLPGECETWREFYLRQFDEREAKFKSITASISASMAKAVPVRQTKLAYIDTVAKPPRSIARKQARYGTAKPIAAIPLKAKTANNQASSKPSTSGSNTVAAAWSATASRQDITAESVTIVQPPAKVVKKIAPLMQKTLKLMRSNFRR